MRRRSNRVEGLSWERKCEWLPTTVAQDRSRVEGLGETLGVREGYERFSRQL